MPLAKKLKDKGMTELPQRKRPLWGGPTEDGITYSLLSRFLNCRERFRLLVVEGLTGSEGFNHRMEFGQMWHVCEEHVDLIHFHGWQDPLKNYCQALCRKYPLQQEAIQHSYNVCKTQFPIYCKFWSKNKESRVTKILSNEHEFSVPYKLPSGRILLLRGKIDGINVVGKGKNARVYMKENKTKGDINEQQLQRQLAFDLQTMIYFTAADYHYQNFAQAGDKLFPEDHGPLQGTYYNVVRRPLAGGRDSIRQKKDETPDEFYTRLGELIEDHPEHYFMRWTVDIFKHDLETFKQQFLHPVGEQLLDWWEFIQHCNYDPFKFPTRVPNHIHDRHPYGVYNSLDEGYSHTLDEYLATGSDLGLRHTDNLFPELTE